MKKLSVPLTFETPLESRPTNYAFRQMRDDIVQWDPATRAYFTNFGWSITCGARTTSATEIQASEE